MSKLTKEDLEYYISDIGLSKTLIQYKLSEKEADNLLNGKVYGESKRFKYVERNREHASIETVLTPDKIQLNRVISENYNSLYKYVVRDKWTVNSRANSQEDIFHNSLLAILKGDFIHKSDEETIYFLRHVFKMTALNELKAVKLTQDKNDQFKQLFQPGTTEQPEINDDFLIKNNGFLNDLSEKQRRIIDFKKRIEKKNTKILSENY